jgi:hypothetical protein
MGNAELLTWTSSDAISQLTLTIDSNNVLTSSVPINATTGFRIGNAAASGKFLVGNGTNYVASTSTIPTSAGATAGKLLVSDGTNYVLSGAITDGEGIQLNNTSIVNAPIDETVNGRLTLTSATPVTTSDVTAATTVYFALYNGDSISLYDGTRWKKQRFTEVSIPVTDSSQTGTWSNSANSISSLTSTSQLMIGMQVTGTNIAANSTITSIDTAHQITMNNAPTGTPPAGTAVTFKLPPSKNYDVFYVQSSGVLQFSNSWTSDSARNDALTTQNGMQVNNAAINSTDFNTIAAKKGLYLGTIRTTGTAGQTEDSAANRFVWNNYNRVTRHMSVVDTTDSWTYTTATWRSADNSTSNSVNVIVGLSLNPITVDVRGICVNANSIAAAVGVGVDSTSTNSAQVFGGFAPSTGSIVTALYKGFLAAGKHNLQWLEISVASGTTTWDGDHGNTENQAGLEADIQM